MANIDNIDDATTVRELEVNDTAYDIVGKGVLDQNSRTTNLEWIGTKAEYEALGTYSDKCTYIITDDSADSQSDEVGAIAEEVNTIKSSVDQIKAIADAISAYDYVIEWRDIGSTNAWYRKYKSGWVEQGGYASGSGTVAITLPVKMKTASYTIVLGNTNGRYEQLLQYGQTTTGFSLKNADGGGSPAAYWQVSGMAA